MLQCIDNSGAALVECVSVLRTKKHAKIGQSRRVEALTFDSNNNYP